MERLCRQPTSDFFRDLPALELLQSKLPDFRGHVCFLGTGHLLCAQRAHGLLKMLNQLTCLLFYIDVPGLRLILDQPLLDDGIFEVNVEANFLLLLVLVLLDTCIPLQLKSHCAVVFMPLRKVKVC